ncbi:PAS domain-containing protein, partial [Haematococcus lacustris]
MNLQTMKPGPEDEVSDDTRLVQQGAFGVMYTVAKATFRLFLDFLQLFLLTVNPQYGFTGFIDNSNIGWQVVSFIGLNQFLANRGYLFFIVALYIMAGALLFNVVLCVWVGYSFQANSFNHVWPIVWLRWFGKVFYQVLDIATLSLFLVALDCQLYGRPEVQGVNQQFPNVYCWSGAHVIHASVAAISIIVFIAFAAFFTLAEMELNPLSRNPLAMAHSGVEVLGFGLKSVMTLAATFLSGTRELSLLYLACSLALLYLYVYWVPHLNPAVNMIRTASYAMVLWTSLVLVLLAFRTVNLSGQQSAEVQEQLTLVMWVGLVPAGLAGALAGWMRLRYFMVTVVNRFRHAPPDMKPRLIFNATDAREVEILSRCCRVWQPEDPEVVEEEAMELASIILKAGLAQLAASDPYMIILYASFLIDVQNSTQSGYTQLQAAKRANPSFLQRFAIFTIEQQHIQQASRQTGKATDLVAYVESMRSYNLVYKAHKDALLAMRAFWAQLLNSKIKFETLSQLVAKLDTTIKAAEQAYKQVLGRHGTNVRLLRLYAKFLEHIKHDPWTAAKWFAEADALELQEEKAKDTNVFADMTGVDPGLRSALTEIDRGNESRAIIIINARCIIQVVNQ